VEKRSLNRNSSNTKTGEEGERVSGFRPSPYKGEFRCIFVAPCSIKEEGKGRRKRSVYRRRTESRQGGGGGAQKDFIKRREGEEKIKVKKLLILLDGSVSDNS